MNTKRIIAHYLDKFNKKMHHKTKKYEINHKKKFS